jgi:hypothetical protein
MIARRVIHHQPRRLKLNATREHSLQQPSGAIMLTALSAS